MSHADVTNADAREFRRRMEACWFACQPFPVEALEAGAVKQAVDLCRDMLAELDRPGYFPDQFSDAWKAFHRRLREVADALKPSEAES